MNRTNCYDLENADLAAERAANGGRTDSEVEADAYNYWGSVFDNCPDGVDPYSLMG